MKNLTLTECYRILGIPYNSTKEQVKKSLQEITHKISSR